MKMNYIISICALALISFATAFSQTQGVPEGKATIVLDRQAVEKLSTEDFALLTDVFNGGQIKPTYLVMDAPEAKTNEIFNKLKSIGFLFEQTKDESIVPKQFAWTGAHVFIKTFFTEIILRDLPADSASRLKLKTLLHDCSKSSFLDNSYPMPENIDQIDLRSAKLEAWCTDFENTSLTVYKLPNVSFINRSDEIINRFTANLPVEKQRIASTLGLDKPRFLARVADLDNQYFSFFVEMTDSISAKSGDFFRSVYEYNYLYMSPGKSKKYHFPSNAVLASGLKGARVNDSILLFAYVTDRVLQFQLFNRLTGRPLASGTLQGSEVNSIANCDLLRIDDNNFVFCNYSQNEYTGLRVSGNELKRTDNQAFSRIIATSLANCTAGMENSKNEIKTRLFASKGMIAVTNAVRHDGYYYRHITSFHSPAGEFMYAIARDYPNERFKLFDCEFGLSSAGLFVVAHKWTTTNWDIEQFWLDEMF